MLWHGEPSCSADERIGHVTSGAYGHTLGAAVGLAWVHGDLPGRGADVGRGPRRAGPRAITQREPFYDPTGERLRG